MTKSLMVVQNERLDNLVERVKAIMVESVFSARLTLLEGKHQIGKEIVEDYLYEKWDKGAGDLVKEIEERVGLGKTEIYMCIRFYREYPEVSTVMEKLPGKKNDITWAATKRLLAGKPIQECSHKLEEISCWQCKICKKTFLNKP